MQNETTENTAEARDNNESGTQPTENFGVYKEERKTNPYGANQWQLDPRQKKFWEHYINPESETFGNGLASALKAGYSENYAKIITVEPWFKEKLRKLNMVSKAEKVLEECLELPIKKAVVKEDEEVVVTDPSLVKIKQDTAKFVAERLGKNEGWSTRTELTGKDGETLSIEISETIAKKNNLYDTASNSERSSEGQP